MRVGILGAGSVAFGTAAFLAHAGHEPVLWSPSGERTCALAAGALLTATNAIACTVAVGVATDCAEAIDKADALLIALPTYGHKAVIDAMVQYVREGLPIIMSSHSSFGALYLSKRLAERGIRLPIIVWGTTLVTGRQRSNTHVHVTTVRQKIDVATLPKSASDEGHALCTALFGDRFVKRDGLLAIALSNLNPQNHLGITLFNLTRMEKGEEWGQGEHVTPAVGRLIEALDGERLAIAQSFGLSVRTVRDHFSLSYHVPMASVSEMNQEMHRQGRGGLGPTTMQSRYILEDVPFGLSPIALLGRLGGHPAILHESGIAILSAAHGRDLKSDNDILPELGLAGMTPEQLKRLCAIGYEKLKRVAP